MTQDSAKESAQEAAEQSTPESAKEALAQQLAQWQTNIDEAKVQLNLAGKDAEDKLQPYIHELDNEMLQAEAKWKQLEKASESSLDDLKAGLDVSINAMSKAFANVKQHFGGDSGDKRADENTESKKSR